VAVQTATGRSCWIVIEVIFVSQPSPTGVVAPVV
jgi:hypothetical protein